MSEDTQKSTPDVTKEAFKDKKVLIVEDAIELAEVIQATLERMGFKVFHETHGMKALELFKNNRPDVVLLDIGLPDMIGWKVLDAIREVDKDNRPYVVVITAYGDPANRLTGKLQDVDSYLIKPFMPDKVEQVIGKLFGVEDSKDGSSAESTTAN
ncbi:MAG: response regulator [Anaerolineae bacterium]|nr:response regulator [Anaerolineae bacterium]